MSYHGWHVGMKVVCIKADPWDLSAGAWHDGRSVIFPRYRQILTIRDMEEWRGCIYLRFVEIVNSTRRLEPSFAIKWFRPVQTRKTDIAVFTALLNKPKVDA